MTMQMPGATLGYSNTAIIVSPEPKRACGVLRMTINSMHDIPITDADGKPIVNPNDPRRRQMVVKMTAKDRRMFASATGHLFCLHKDCRGKKWKDERECLAAHPDTRDMIANEEVHVVGFYSNDPCNPPDPSCPKCNEKGKPPRACAEHAGGVVGLLTPGEPAVMG